MAYLLPHSLILHIPKTGSDWVRSACQAAVRGRITELGSWHCNLASARRLVADQGRSIRWIGTFVRHPLTWYRSAWTYWMETGRFPRDDDEPRVECDDFAQFVCNCLTVEPRGYVSMLYERFTGCGDAEVSFVGRQETLADDLVRFLTLAGEKFDERALRAVPPRNVRGSRADSCFSGFRSEVVEMIVTSERQSCNRFGYSTETGVDDSGRIALVGVGGRIPEHV